MDTKTSTHPSFCPSAQPDWKDSVAIGVVGGTAGNPRVTHLSNTLPVTEDLLALTTPVTPGEVFRFAAPCLRSGCVHFKHDQCSLAGRIVRLLPEVTARLPICPIRPRCCWWQQEGKAACARCPQVVTDNYNPSREMRQAAKPTSQPCVSKSCRESVALTAGSAGRQGAPKSASAPQ